MWIEITVFVLPCHQFTVTPYAGVWIEIANFSKNSVPANVTPYAGVWIEITTKQPLALHRQSHSLRGSVD